MRDCFLAKEEHLVNIVMLPCTGADARVYLFELGHDRQHFIINDLCCAATGGQV